MLISQTGQAKRFRKYSITFAVILALSGAFAALLTLHWYVPQPAFRCRADKEEYNRGSTVSQLRYVAA